MFRTKQQRKELCAACPIAKVADLIGDPCTLLVIRELLKAPKRFSELESALHGISSRTLSNKLKELQEHGIIKRKLAKTTATHEAYFLMPKGIGLRSVTLAMKKYGEKYL